MRIQTGAGGVAAIAAIALALTACGPKKEAPKPRPTLTVSAATVQLTSLPRRVDATGTIAAWQEVPVGAETGGLEAVQVLVDEGSYVRQGQLLVKLNDTLLRAQLAQQQATVASAQATLAQNDAALARAQELRQRGFLSQASLDTALANQRTARANVAAAQAGLAETRARLDQTNIRAPVAGLITARSVVKGQIVAAGTELFRLVRQGQIELNAQVPQADLALVRVGQVATVTGENAGTTTGVVRIVTPQVDPQTRLGLARITLPSGSGFRPGNFARASIDVGAQPAMVVPSAAIVFREGKAGVYVIDSASRVHFRPVKAGNRSGGMVEVTGLTAGQRVAVQGAGFLAEGNLVTVTAPGVTPRAAAPAPAKK